MGKGPWEIISTLLFPLFILHREADLGKLSSARTSTLSFFLSSISFVVFTGYIEGRGPEESSAPFYPLHYVTQGSDQYLGKSAVLFSIFYFLFSFLSTS